MTVEQQVEIQRNAEIINHGLTTVSRVLSPQQYDLVAISGVAHYVQTGNPRSIMGRPDDDYALPIDQYDSAIADLEQAQADGHIHGLMVTSIDGTSEVYLINNSLTAPDRQRIQYLINSGSARIAFDTEAPTLPYQSIMEHEIFLNRETDGLAQLGTMTEVGRNTHTVDVSGE